MNFLFFQVEVKKVKPKMTKAEKSAAAKAEEAKVRKAEDKLLENTDPVSPDGFDRMLLAQPDNSELWVKYMAYHLQVCWMLTLYLVFDFQS